MRHVIFLSLFACLPGLVPANAGAAEAANPAGNSVILVLPFATPPGSTESWMGRAVQQDLETDLMEGTQARVIAPSTAAPAADSAQALATARQMRADIVVFGQVQVSSNEVRLTGQVLDVSGDKTLGPLKATGPTSDLFHLEDALAGQTLGLLPRSLLSARAASALSHPADWPQAATPQQSTPPQVLTPPRDSSTYAVPGTYTTAPQPSYSYSPAPDFYPGYAPDYGNAYPVPAYTYGYPYYDLFPSYGFGISLGFGGDFDHFHLFDHGGGGRFGGAGFGNRGLSVPRGTGPRLGTSGFARPGGFRSGPMGGFRSAPRTSGFSGGLRRGAFGGFHGGGFGGGFHGGGMSHGGGGGRR